MNIVQSDQLKLVTGATGSPHVSSAEAGEQNIAAFGTGVVALGGEHPVSVSEGAIHINKAELMFDGRHITIPSPITCTIDTAGTYAYAVFLRYTHGSSGQETATIEILKSDSSGVFDDDDHDYTSDNYSPRYGSTTARRELAYIPAWTPRQCYPSTVLLPAPLMDGQMVVHQKGNFSGETTTLLKKLPRGATVYTQGGEPCQLRAGSTVRLDKAELVFTTAGLGGARWKGGVQIRAALSGCIMHADIRAVCQQTITPQQFQETDVIAVAPAWARPSMWVQVVAPVTSISRPLTKALGWGVQVSPTTGEIGAICLDKDFQVKAGDVLHAHVSWVIPTAA